MNELIKSYIGKEVIIWAGSSSGVTGTMTRIEDNWVEIEDKDGNKRTGYSLMVEGFDFVDAAPEKNRAEAAAERVASSFDKYGEDLGDF